MPLHPWRSQAYLFRSVSRQCGPQRMDYAWRREANLWHESPEGQHLLVLVVTVIDTSQTIHWLVDSVCAGSHACSHARSRRRQRHSQPTGIQTGQVPCKPCIQFHNAKRERRPSIRTKSKVTMSAMACVPACPAAIVIQQKNSPQSKKVVRLVRL